MPKAVILLVIIAVVLIVSPQASAVDTKARLQIAPRQCTVDTLNTGISQVSVLQPEECRGGGVSPLEEPVPAPIENGHDTTGSAAMQLAEQDDHPGNQALFENTIIESIASVIGVGNKSASPVAPVAASTVLVSVVGVAVDLAFFQLRFTQWLVAALRGGLASAISVLIRIVLRR